MVHAELSPQSWWQVLEALQQGASHDALVCCAGYVLGEYGRLVKEVPTHVQFALLHERFLTVSNETKVGCMKTRLRHQACHCRMRGAAGIMQVMQV